MDPEYIAVLNQEVAHIKPLVVVDECGKCARYRMSGNCKLPSHSLEIAVVRFGFGMNRPIVWAFGSNGSIDNRSFGLLAIMCVSL